MYFPKNTTTKKHFLSFFTLIVNISRNHRPENRDTDEAAREANAEVP